MRSQKDLSIEQNAKNTPSSLGYHMPAEWEEHEGTWLSWPKDPITWPRQIRQVEKIYGRMIEILTQGEKVFLLVDDDSMENYVRKILSPYSINRKQLTLYQIPTVDAWIRDYGPNFLIQKDDRKKIAFNHWIFNAWGGKYEDIKADNGIPQKIHNLLKIKMFEPGIILEGGSIDVNGCGACLTTEQCLLSPNRNSQLTKDHIEKYLKKYLNVTHILWLGHGIIGDDTDGHVDDIARFVNPTTVVCALEEDPKDANYSFLRENYDRLLSSSHEKGKKLNVIALPMPGNVSYRGRRLPASYANFYIANHAVLVPIFKHPNDEKALYILKDLFSNREVIGIPCNDLVVGNGTLHCITQQQPKSS